MKTIAEFLVKKHQNKNYIDCIDFDIYRIEYNKGGYYNFGIFDISKAEVLKFIVDKIFNNSEFTFEMPVNVIIKEFNLICSHASEYNDTCLIALHLSKFGSIYAIYDLGLFSAAEGFPGLKFNRKTCEPKHGSSKNTPKKHYIDTSIKGHTLEDFKKYCVR